MDLKQKYREETNLEPYGDINQKDNYTRKYVKWLEKQCTINGVSISFIDQIKKQIEYHKEQENTRASVKDYGQAIYHNNRRGALEDLLVWIKLNEC